MTGLILNRVSMLVVGMTILADLVAFRVPLLCIDPTLKFAVNVSTSTKPESVEGQYHW